MTTTRHATSAVLALLLGLGLAACSNRGTEDAAPAPVDSGVPGPADTAATPDTSMATPPITPPAQPERDSAQDGAASPAQPSDAPAEGQGGKISLAEYEGWRQYSVNCARCHGQDVLPNPVAANLLISLAPGGPMESPEAFMQVVSEGRPARGMPAVKGVLTPSPIQSIYAYVKGRADRRIPPGRPDRPEA